MGVLSEEAVVFLVGAEGDKGRRKKLVFVVSCKMDWVERQL